MSVSKVTNLKWVGDHWERATTAEVAAGIGVAVVPGGEAATVRGPTGGVPKLLIYGAAAAVVGVAAFFILKKRRGK
jgi:hypothetical protein